MRELQTEEREFEIMLELVHADGLEGAKRLREQLKIFVEPKSDAPLIIPESIVWDFDGGYADTYRPFTGEFDEMFPNGYELDLRAEELPLRQGAENYNLDKESLQFTRFTMRIDYTSQYMWDDDADFEEQGWYENVINPSWDALKFEFGDTHVMAAYKTMLDS